MLLVASYMFVEQSTIITIVNYGCNTFIAQTKDWSILYHLGYFRKIIVIFLKTAQRNVDFWAFGTIFRLLFEVHFGSFLDYFGYLLVYFSSAIFTLHFHMNKQHPKRFIESIFRLSHGALM